MWGGVTALVLAGLPLFFMYTSVNRFGVKRSNAVILGVIYWIVLALSTIFLIYYDIIVPYNAASAAGTALPFSMKYVIPFVAYVIIMLAMTVASST